MVKAENPLVDVHSPEQEPRRRAGPCSKRRWTRGKGRSEPQINCSHKSSTLEILRDLHHQLRRARRKLTDQLTMNLNLSTVVSKGEEPDPGFKPDAEVLLSSSLSSTIAPSGHHTPPTCFPTSYQEKNIQLLQ
ncbi:unnamed protein product [Pleuronectes platessa]|uniref:Uncharacterized protein n=1 Tax=Pleuronectes platessa TaxID=8262 RepID=A0A9N7UB72_PLEPL|nr:unnamed protein product [Pleuronectes platessa]